jgi:hypothetical protein
VVPLQATKTRVGAVSFVSRPPTTCTHKASVRVGPRACLGYLGEINTCWPCWESNHDASVTSPYPSHYTDCAIPGATSHLIISTRRMCLLRKKFLTSALHVEVETYGQPLPDYCSLISFACRCVIYLCLRVSVALFSPLSVSLRTALSRLYRLLFTRYLLTKFLWRNT